mgnify:CR=1 FL=1
MAPVRAPDSELNLTIEELQRYARTLARYEQFNLQLGWTLSHIGSTQLRKGDQPKAIERHENSLKVLGRLRDPIVLETYLGLAEAYQGVAVNGRPGLGRFATGVQRRRISRRRKITRSRAELSAGALVQDSRLVADTHLRLARLYVDAGQTRSRLKLATSAQSKEGNEVRRAIRSPSNERAELAAMRELAEFYQGQENGYGSASTLSVEMITVRKTSQSMIWRSRARSCKQLTAILARFATAKVRRKRRTMLFAWRICFSRRLSKMRRLGKTSKHFQWGCYVTRTGPKSSDDLRRCLPQTGQDFRMPKRFTTYRWRIGRMQRS